MNKCFQIATGVAFCLFHATTGAQPAQRTDCRTSAIQDLAHLSPQGFAIYKAMADKNQFLTWLTCDDVQTGLSTAVHESVHVLTEERDAFPLINGGTIRRPHQVSTFFAPSEIRDKFDANDVYVQNYLGPDGVSSKGDFLYLLDELNAYSHDLNSAVKLTSLQNYDRKIDHRDGLAAVMTFVMGYIYAAQKEHPAAWQGLLRSPTKQVVRTLWIQAETTLASSCGIPKFGLNDHKYVRYLRDRKNSGALAEVLGRLPECPQACL